MGETLALFKTSFNKSLSIVSRPDRLTGEAGAVILRELMERSGVIEWLDARLHDPRVNADCNFPKSAEVNFPTLVLR